MENILNTKNKNYVRNYLLLICILGALLRITHCGVSNRLERDAILYIQTAKNWVHKDFIREDLKNAFYLPPLLVTILATGEIIGIDGEFTGKFVGIILGLLLVISIYHISFILFKNQNLALIAAFLASIHPNLIKISCSGIRDTLYIPIICFAVLFAMFAIKNNKYLYWGLFSLFAILGVMSRTEGMEILFFYFLWIPIYLIVKRKKIKTNFVIVLKSLSVVLITYAILLMVVINSYKNSHYKNWKPLKTERAIRTIKSFFMKSTEESLNKDA